MNQKQIPHTILALSRVTWNFQYADSSYKLHLSPLQSPTKEQEELVTKDTFELQGIRIPYEESAGYTLIFHETVQPFALSSLQLREQSEYLLEVESTSEETALSLECFPQFEPPILKTAPIQSRRSQFIGRLHFRDYVGSTRLEIWHEKQCIFSKQLEVRSQKLFYLFEYTALLNELSAHTSDLLLRLDSPVTAPFTIEASHKKSLGYEKFLLFRHLVNSQLLEDAIFRIQKDPSRELHQHIKDCPLGRRSPRNAQELQSGYQKNKGLIPTPLSLKQRGLPGHLPSYYNRKNVTLERNTPENRFIKTLFSEWIQSIIELERGFAEAKHIQYLPELADMRQRLQQLENRLELPRTLRPLQGIPLPRQRLQGRPGYRELLQVWDQLQQILVLQWHDVAELLAGPIKDLAKLYELWCFFELARALEHIAKPLIPLQSYLQKGPFDLQLDIPTGGHNALYFVYGPLHIRLFFQRHFRAGQGKQDSYSVPLRPDYTLEITLPGEKQFLLCFDAKYRPEGSLEKMHAYRDALRSAVGCYLFYPGTEKNPTLYTNDPREALLGVGAFPLRPRSNTRSWLSAFLSVLFDQILKKNEPTPSQKSH